MTRSFQILAAAATILSSALTVPLNPALGDDQPPPQIEPSYAERHDERPHLVLSSQDAKLYQTIFRLQKAGKMDDADIEIEKIDDKRLLGYVLAQRYLHPTAYTSTVDELALWLNYYQDHPMADRLYKLAQKKAKRQNLSVKFKKPTATRKIPPRREPTMVSAKPYHKRSLAKGAKASYNQSLESQILRALRKGQRDRAVDMVFKADKDASASAAQLDYLKGKVAESYLYKGHVKMAHELASQAFNRSGDIVPVAGWVYGLTTWYNGNYEAAAKGFEAAASSKYNSGWMRAAASYWAARAFKKTKDRKSESKWLKAAQKYPRTFYGLLATKAAGKRFDFNWRTPTLTQDMVRAMAQQHGTMRALALMDIGRYDLAEQELLYTKTTTRLLRSAMLAFAQSYDMAELSLRLGGHVRYDNNEVYDAALYPTLDVETIGKASKGYKHPIDTDLVHAIMRQESQFNPLAKSKSGAVGLMQVMPDTAKYVSKLHKANYTGARDLLLPQNNIAIGQKYIQTLLSHKLIKDDVLALLVSYNAGPGNYKKWRALWHDVEDPLLFIELLPASETRTYVEKVMANYWIYRIKNIRDLSPMKLLLDGAPLKYATIIQDLPFAVANTK